MRATFWTRSRHARLVALAGRGKSASQIAAVIGDGCTRAMVIGRAWRKLVVIDSTGARAALSAAARIERQRGRLQARIAALTAQLRALDAGGAMSGARRKVNRVENFNDAKV